jgi:hypothetical protein
VAFLYMFACNAVANRLSFLCCVCLSSSSVFYTQCCQFLWIVHSRLSLRYSLTFICPLSCIPNVTSFSRLSILHCPSVLFVFVLCLVYPMLPVSLDCPFFIAPQFCLSSSCVLYAQCCQFLWIVHSSLPPQFCLSSSCVLYTQCCQFL